MRITTFSQPEQRRTIPGPCVKASSVPISPSLPQCAHSVGEAVISAPKISYSKPAVALASSMSSRLMSVVSSISASCGPEPLGTDLVRVDPDFYKCICGGLDPQRGSADEASRGLSQRSCAFPQPGLLYPPRVPLP